MKAIAIIFLTLAHAVLVAQPAAEDPLGKAFFSPDLVMQNQQAISLTETQRTNILKEMQSAQSEFMTIQWDMQKETEKLKTLAEKESPVETEVIAQLDRLLSLESKVKHRQITLMVRIKNSLTAEQQDKLRKIRK